MPVSDPVVRQLSGACEQAIGRAANEWLNQALAVGVPLCKANAAVTRATRRLAGNVSEQLPTGPCARHDDDEPAAPCSGAAVARSADL